MSDRQSSRPTGWVTRSWRCLRFATCAAIFPGSRCRLPRGPSIAPVFRAVPGIDRIIVLERGKESSQLRGDIGILLPNSFRSAWILKKAGVKERWGYRSDFRRPLLTRSVPKPRGRVSFPEYYSNLVRQLGIETGPLTAQLQVPAAASAAALSLLQERGWQPGQPLVGIAPGAAFGHAKRWSPKRYAELASLLIDAGVACVILGRSEDRDAARDIKGIDLDRADGFDDVDGRRLALQRRRRERLGRAASCWRRSACRLSASGDRRTSATARR